MARSTLTPLQRQLRRVRRRLLLQGLLESLVVAWVAAIAASAAWFFVQPFAIADAWPPLRWIIAGGAVATATLGGIAWAVLRQPSSVSAALALDERFGLKERVTTTLTLHPAHAASPAALALLEDVNGRVGALPVPERFPVRLPRSTWLLPLGGAALALIAVFYKPLLQTAKVQADQPLTENAAVQAAIDQKMRELQKKAHDKKPDDKDRSAELERLEAELDRVARQPRDTKEQAREIIKDLAGIEEQIKQREKALEQRVDALKEQLKQAERTSRKDSKDGPARDLNKALEQGDLGKAKEAVERLAKQLKAEEEAEKLEKKLKDKNATKEERDKAQQQLDKLKNQRMAREDKDKLADQMNDLKDKIEKLSRSKEEKEKALRDLAKKGDIDPEQLQRELEQLDRDADKLNKKDLENLREMADKLGRCKQCLSDGDDLEASKLLEELADMLDSDRELQELHEKLQECEGCKKAMCQVLDGKPVPAAGRRPESKEGVTSSVDQRERSKMSKGRLTVVDTVPGEGFKGPRKPAELTEEIRRATQEAPEAIDRQRLPRSASDMAKGYFEKLRGEKEKKEKP